MTNLSQIKRNKMNNFLERLKEKTIEDDQLAALNELQNFLQEYRYGMVFEKHEEAVDKLMNENFLVFSEDVSKKIISSESAPLNFLLEGDNLHSLYLLEKTHKGKVDVIYIDPPYNTRNQDFKYNDSFVNPDDSYKHSKWLSFMERRLRIARELLTKEGVIFISIDDGEYANLKLLCDDIFGYNNSIGPFIQNKQNQKNDTLNIQKNHEYILVYRKMDIKRDGKSIPSLGKTKIIQRKVIREDNTYFYLSDPLTTRGDGGVLAKRKNLGYTYYFNEQTKHIIVKADYDLELALTSNDESEVYNTDESLVEKGYIVIRPPRVRNQLGAWTWELDRVKRNISDIYLKKGRTRNYSVHSKKYVSVEDVYEENGKYFFNSIKSAGNSRSVLDEYPTSDGTKQLSKIMGPGKFNNPKNVDMLKYFISLFEKKDILVLDFFAGSGSTGQAVIELNKEDHQKRRFILCTNNENNIAEEITYNRIKSIIRGYEDMTASDESYIEGIPSNLKYYKTDFIKKGFDEDVSLTDELLEHVNEMVELEFGVDLASNDKVDLILDEEELDRFFNEELVGNTTLLVPNFVLLKGTQELLASEKNIKVIRVPDYYFTAELKEVGEL